MILAKLPEKVDFTSQNIYVGIDVHKSSWNVSIYVGDKLSKTFHQKAKVGDLERHLKTHYPGGNIFCGYEAGFSGFWIQRELSKRGLRCLIINPADIPVTDKDRKNKTDSNDSKRLALALQANLVKGIYIPSEEIEYDRRLVRCRKTVTKDLTRVKNRIKNELFLHGIEIPPIYKGWSKKFIQWLKELNLNSSIRQTLNVEIMNAEHLRLHLLDLNKQVRKLLQEEKYKVIGDLLLSIPGIGSITAISLITEVGDIHRFKHFNHFNSFIGFCPTEHSSGEKERKGRMTPRSHKILRSAIVESAWISLKTDTALAACYEEFTKRMTGKRAIIKIARKLLNRIYTTWKYHRPYIKGIN